jgi:hypothetical protein
VKEEKAEYFNLKSSAGFEPVELQNPQEQVNSFSR